MEGDHLPAGFNCPHSLPWREGCYLPSPCWCQELPRALLSPFPPPAVLAPHHDSVYVPLSAPSIVPFLVLPSPNSLVQRTIVSNSTGDNSRQRPTPNKMATVSCNEYCCSSIAAVMEVCCFCLSYFEPATTYLLPSIPHDLCGRSQAHPTPSCKVAFIPGPDRVAVVGSGINMWPTKGQWESTVVLAGPLSPQCSLHMKEVGSCWPYLPSWAEPAWKQSLPRGKHSWKMVRSRITAASFDHLDQTTLDLPLSLPVPGTDTFPLVGGWGAKPVWGMPALVHHWK